MDFIPSQNNLSIKQSLSKGKISYANDDDDGEERLVQGGNYNIPYSNNNVPSSSYNNYQSSGISDSKNSDDYRPSMNNGSSSPGT